MISNVQLKQAYNKIYAQMRNYIWDISAVIALATLEVACYETCPDLPRASRALTEVKLYVNEAQLDDQELSDALDGLEKLLDVEANDYYAELYAVNEVLK